MSSGARNRNRKTKITIATGAAAVIIGADCAAVVRLECQGRNEFIGLCVNTGEKFGRGFIVLDRYI